MAVATLRNEEAIIASSGIGVMTHEMTFNELLVESQYLLKLQSGKITKIPRLVTAKCPRQIDAM